MSDAFCAALIWLLHSLLYLTFFLTHPLLSPYGHTQPNKIGTNALKAKAAILSPGEGPLQDYWPETAFLSARGSGH